MTYTKEQIAMVAEMLGSNATKAEKYLKQLYKDLEDDTVTFEDMIEVIKCEIKRKENGVKNVVTSAKKSENKDKKPRTVKVSTEKIFIFEMLQNALKNAEIDNFYVEKENKLIILEKNGKIFKLDLIEQRQKTEK